MKIYSSSGMIVCQRYPMSLSASVKFLLVKVGTQEGSCQSLLFTWSSFGLSYLKQSFVTLSERFLGVLQIPKLILSSLRLSHQLETPRSWAINKMLKVALNSFQHLHFDGSL